MSKRKKKKIPSIVVTPVKSKIIMPVKSKIVMPVKSEVVTPVKSEVAAPVKSKVVAPVKSEVVAPVKSEDVAPVKSEVVAPVKSEVVAPVKSEVVAPVKSEVAAPVVITDPFDCPGVSVVIPMYNAEKYIAECLESILAQSFKNYELIVVDDCSTDNSPAIVDSFIPKFGGRLTHFRLQKNSGGAGIPRNTGVTLARGEYIRFIDSDDRITENALEEDFTLAKKYDADVVYHTRFYDLSADGTESTLAAIPKYQPGDDVVLDNDLLTRVRELSRNKYYHAPWRSFSRRDFLIANELYFPDIRPYEDIVWNYALLIYSERFLRVPSAIYFYRDNEDSMLRKEKTAAQNAKFYLNPIILGMKSLDTFISRNKFFETKPQLYYALLENYFSGRFRSLFRDSSELSSSDLYAILKDEFGDGLGKYDILIPALCTALAHQQKVAAIKMEQFKEYAAQAEQRIIELTEKIRQRKGSK